MKVLILGGSGIGMIAAYIFKQQAEVGDELLGFLNDNEKPGTWIGKHQFKVPVLGRSEDVREHLKRDRETYFFVAYVGIPDRKKQVDFIKSLEIPDDRLVGCVDRTASIPQGAVGLGRGCLIGPHAQLGPDVTIGKCVHVLGHAFVGHDTIVHDYVTLANNAAIGANNDVGEGVFVGTNAATKEYVRLGRYSVVGMGAVVLKSTEYRQVVVGNPARAL